MLIDSSSSDRAVKRFVARSAEYHLLQRQRRLALLRPLFVQIFSAIEQALDNSRPRARILSADDCAQKLARLRVFQLLSKSSALCGEVFLRAAAWVHRPRPFASSSRIGPA